MPLDRPPLTLLQGSSLFLDFDGTLVELAPTPDTVRVDDRVLRLLADLQVALDGRLALLSGRAVSVLQAYVQPLELALAGSHGLERLLTDGGIQSAEPPESLPSAILEFRRVEARHPGVLVEEKPAGVALHYRNAPEAESLCQEVAQRVAATTGMAVQPGKMVVELKDSAADKGRALAQFMSEPPFAGTKPVFIGDDLTDEHAFAASRLAGGTGVLVGPERATAAACRLDDVHDVWRWLEQACEELR